MEKLLEVLQKKIKRIQVNRNGAGGTEVDGAQAPPGVNGLAPGQGRRLRSLQIDLVGEDGTPEVWMVSTWKLPRRSASQNGDGDG